MNHPPTQTEIRALLAEAGLRPDRRFGQHFLVDGNLMRLLVAEADLGPTDTVLEVGPGMGNLTQLLVAAAGRVVAVEVDAALARIARRRLASATNLTLLVCDVLADKHRISPRVLEAVAAGQAATGGSVKLVANLPYAAATPLVAELVWMPRPPERLVFTVQQEVAERLSARPGTRQYGPVSVVVQALAQVEVLRRMGPRVFWPLPKVASAMVRIRPDLSRRAAIANATVFRQTVEGLFLHRRKMAARSLALADPQGRTPQWWSERLATADLDPEARGETFTVAQIVRLANSLAAG